MDYETLDVIADAYIPALAVLFLIGVLYRCYMHWPQWRSVASIFLYSLCLLMVAYALMFIDSLTQLWPKFGSDYSTHTAVSVALVASLCVLYPRRKTILIAMIIGYAALMCYQKYHSISDIVSTAGVILLFAIPFYKNVLKVGNS